MMHVTPFELLIMNELHDGPMDRDELVQRLKKPRTTIYNRLKRLISIGRVEKFPDYRIDMKRGRPRILFSLVNGHDHE